MKACFWTEVGITVRVILSENVRSCWSGRPLCFTRPAQEYKSARASHCHSRFSPMSSVSRPVVLILHVFPLVIPTCKYQECSCMRPTSLNPMTSALLGHSWNKCCWCLRIIKTLYIGLIIIIIIIILYLALLIEVCWELFSSSTDDWLEGQRPPKLKHLPAEDFQMRDPDQPLGPILLVVCAGEVAVLLVWWWPIVGEVCGTVFLLLSLVSQCPDVERFIASHLERRRHALSHPLVRSPF